MVEARVCPFCAEEIKPEAIRCKHCGADLTPKPPKPLLLRPVNARIVIAVGTVGAIAGILMMTVGENADIGAAVLLASLAVFVGGRLMQD